MSRAVDASEQLSEEPLEATELLAYGADMLRPDLVRRALRRGARPSNIPLYGMPGRHVLFDALGALLTGIMLFDDEDFDDLRADVIRAFVEYGCIDGPHGLDDLFGLAVSGGCGPAVAQCFLDAGGSVAGRMRARTPLHKVQRADTARLLLAAGADVHAVTDCGRTPLHELASTAPHLIHDLVPVLTDAGARLDARDSEGGTPLHCAVHDLKHRAPAVLETLLSAGADPTITDCWSRTPTGVALEGLTSRIRAEALDPTATRASLLLLARAEAWWRRRHVLLAVRSSRHIRTDGAASATGATVTAAAASDGGGQSAADPHWSVALPAVQRLSSAAADDAGRDAAALVVAASTAADASDAGAGSVCAVGAAMGVTADHFGVLSAALRACGVSAPAFELLYQASVDGVTLDDAVRKCSGKGPVLVIGRESTRGWLFGGFMDVGISDELGALGGLFSAPRAFVFSLTNPHGTQPTVRSRGVDPRGVFRGDSRGLCWHNTLQASPGSLLQWVASDDGGMCYKARGARGVNAFTGSEAWAASDVLAYRVWRGWRGHGSQYLHACMLALVAMHARMHACNMRCPRR